MGGLLTREWMDGDRRKKKKLQMQYLLLSNFAQKNLTNNLHTSKLLTKKCKNHYTTIHNKNLSAQPKNLC